MNGLLWIAQLTLAAVFFIAAFGKLFAYEKVMKAVESAKGRAVTLSHREAILVAIAEIAGAIGVLMPDSFAPPHLIVLCSAIWLALLMVGAGFYHLRRQEPAAPNVALFLLALFILVGRWPRG